MKKKASISFFTLYSIIFLILSETSSVYGMSKDSITIEQLINSGDEMEYSNPDSAIYYYRQALFQSNKIENLHLLGRSYLNIAYFKSSTGDLDSADFFFSESLHSYKQANDTLGRAKALYGQASAYSLAGNYALAVENLYKALDLFKSIDSPFELYTLEAIGINLNRYNDYSGSIEILEKARLLEKMLLSR